MAIQATFTTDNGEVHEDTYIKVIGYDGYKSECNCMAVAFVSQEASQNNGESYQCLVASFDYDQDSSDNITAQAYTALKELDQITNPVNV